MSVQTPFRIQLGRDVPPPPVDLEDGKFFSFPIAISTTSVDSYFTRMSRRTLQNFSRDANDGRAFLEAHDSSRLPIGTTYSASLVEEDGVETAQAHVYMLLGTELRLSTYASTDDLARAIRARIVNDVSAGFYGGDWNCDICGQDFFGDCPHFPGVKYVISGDPDRVAMCTIEVDGANLSEVSAVYDGATPGAGVLRKAQRLAREGELTGLQRHLVSLRYGVDLPDVERIWTGASAPKVEERIMNLQEDVRDTAEAVDTGDTAEAVDTGDTAEALGAVQAQLDAAATRIQEISDLTAGFDGDTAQERVQALVTAHDAARERVQELDARVQELDARVQELEPLAQRGREYHSALVQEAIEAGIIAQGDRFPADTYRELLASATIEHIRGVIAGLRKQAEDALPRGRQTQSDNDEVKTAKASVPPQAFM